MMKCHDSRQISLRIRQALAEFRDSLDVGDVGTCIGVGDDAEDAPGESLHDHAAELEQENQELQEKVEAQAKELEALARRAKDLKGRPCHLLGPVPVGGEKAHRCDWRPPRRGSSMAVVGVVTVEEQPDEAHAFGLAAPLVAGWRQLWGMSEAALCRTDRPVAVVRWWDLEAELLQGFQLTLPPETDPLDESRRKGHVSRRE